jgi:predicted nucleotidyltransferase
MTASLKTSLASLQLTTYRTLFEDLQATQQALGVEFCLIGALARDIWFRARLGIDSARATDDLDATVYLQDLSQWENVRTFLIEQAGYNKQPGSPIKLRKAALKMDILPIGALEDENREVKLPGRGGELQTLGMREVYAQAVRLEIEEGFQGRIATVAQICLLKIFSYHVQPHHRYHDLSDIREMADVYFDLESDRIFEQHPDLLVRYDGDDLLTSRHTLALDLRQHAIGYPQVWETLRAHLRQLAQTRPQEPIWAALSAGIEGG